MRVACDTNVLISGVLFNGPPRQVLSLAAQGLFTNYTSPALLREAEKVLLYPKFGLRPEQALRIVAIFREMFEIVIPATSVNTVLADPADNRVLEAAQAAAADFIISGDKKHLLNLKEWKGIRIISPEAFLEMPVSDDAISD